MGPTEMGKFMVWMLGVFPQWKPDPAVAVAWAGELPDLTADQAISLVRILLAKKPSPFPPSVFEIVAMTRPRPESGREVFQQIIASFGGHPRPFGARVERAVRLMGGWHSIGQSNEGDPFVERKFMQIWGEIGDEELEAQTSLPCGQVLFLEGPQ